ncbi:nucleic acid-binding protein [Paracoccidioides lutzii Pb01]|uniref:Nucleic acid-binding protein n=1 Tax=Paracoccidioides lutzii (strain ATCC MYA-826 / Pb01) TaxID=502779 RepID=C1H1M8_PARBA|nr:nucleic acid-binding protein [Paracoccidioides lutzii Pb01]EEH33765.2 nucleic acid-binding protein [Paracoccidioides lutzii Pb01]
MYDLAPSVWPSQHTAFRAICAAPAALAVKPGTLAAIAPSLLKLSGQVTNVAFQQRWNSQYTPSIVRRTGLQGFRNDVPISRPAPDVRPNETIYIGNLFFEVTADDLKRDMSKFGNILAVRIVYDNRGMSRGFAYVQFDSVDAAEAAIAEMNMTIYEGRRVVVNYSSRGSANPTPTRSNEPTRTLFIGNLSFEMTDRELNELFKDIKNVTDVRVSVDRRTGQPRGFAHADFLDVESAQAAFEILKDKAPYGRPLRLDYSLSARDSTMDRLRTAPSGSNETF